VDLSGADERTLDVLVDGRRAAVDARFLREGVVSLVLTDDGRQFEAILERGPDGTAVLVSGRRYEFAVDDPRSLRSRCGAGGGVAGPRSIKAPMPGRVVRLLVAEGEVVEEHQGLIVIEAMKMQNELKSPKAGRVVKVAVAVDGTVGSGEVLVVVE
jgi:biotin carboxyl carrier protein